MDADDVKAITKLLLRGVYPPGLGQLEKRSLRQRSTAFVCDQDDAGTMRLYHCGKAGNKWQLVITNEAVKQEIIRAAHLESSDRVSSALLGETPSHNGVNTTIRNVNSRYWWRHIVQDVRNFCKNCSDCCRRFRTSHERLADEGSGNGNTHRLLHLEQTIQMDSVPELHLDGLSDPHSGCQPESHTNCQPEFRLDCSPEPPRSDNLLEALELQPPSPTSMTLHSPDYACNLLSFFRELRDQQAFCDVVVSSCDGAYHARVHKILLLATSGYLRSIFLDPSVALSDFIQLPNISGKCLKVIIDYLYSGTLSLVPDAVSDILAAAAHLEIPGIAELCRDYTVHMENKKPLLSCEMSMSAASSDGIAEVLNLAEQPAVIEELEAVCETVVHDSEVRISPPLANSIIQSSSSAARNRRKKMQRPTLVGSRLFPLAKTSARMYETRADHQYADMSIKRSSQALPVDKALSRKAVSLLNCAQSATDGMQTNSTRHRRSTRVGGVKNSGMQGSTVEIVSTVNTVSSPKSSSIISFPHTKSRKSWTSTVCSALLSPGTTTRCVRKVPLLWLLSRCLLRRAIICLAKSSFCKSTIATSSPPFLCCLCNRREFSTWSSVVMHCICKHSQITRDMYGLTYLRNRLWQTGRLCREMTKHLWLTSRSRIPLSYQQHGMTEIDSAAKTQTGPMTHHRQEAAVLMCNRCGWCGKKFGSRTELINHRQSVHLKPKRDRVVCTSTAVRRQRVKLRDWSCLEKDCQAVFKTEDMLREHMTAVHPSVFYSCPHCQFKTQLEAVLQRHVHRRHRERYNCTICGKAFHVPFLMRIHMYNQHKVVDPLLKLHHCPHDGCGYAYPTKHGITQHLVKHVQTSAFVCHLCGKAFKRSLGLDKHLKREHTTAHLYICDQCGVSCVDAPELRLHMVRHHATCKPYSCQYCSFSSFKKFSLKAHLFKQHQERVDTRQIPVLRCELCTFITDSRADYNEHIRVHRNMRDLPCPYCTKMFIRKQTLRQHVFRAHHQQRTAMAVTDGNVAKP